MQLRLSSKEHLSRIVTHKQQFPLISPDQLIEACKHSKCAVITDAKISKLYGKQLIATLRHRMKQPLEIILPSGEKGRSLLSVQQCWKTLHDEKFDKNSCIISLGGGTILNTAGFTAATYLQGINIIHIPTTLIGMVDMAIGGKSGIDFAEGKDVIGAIHEPQFIWIFPDLLKTQPDREFRSGLAEVIKCGVIQNPLLFDYLENHLDAILAKDPEALYTIVKSCSITKAEIMKHRGDKNGDILNWGETFANAIESATGYKQYLHGEAEAIGMSCAAELSYKLGFSKKDLIAKQDALSKRAGLPLKLPKVSTDLLMKIIEQDKKSNTGTISLIVAEKIGKAFKVPDIDIQKIREVLDLKARG